MVMQNNDFGLEVGLLNKVIQEGSALRSKPLPFYTQVW